MSAAPDITIHRLTTDRLDDFLGFMAERAFADNPEWAGCYCWFPYHDPATTDFDALAPEARRDEMAAAVRGGHAGGYLAYADGRVVGWVNSAPRERYPQLAGLPGDGASTAATPCFAVDPEWRGRGIAARLLQAAIEGARQEGLARMEAVPLKDAQTHADRHRGTVALYEAAGYETVTVLPSGNPLMQKRL
jgi:GNAT superfamily N-acetyltransferase